MKQLSIFLLVLSFVFPVYSQQEKIVEKVAVEYWVVPVFAIGKDGKSITDLDPSEIQLKVNNRSVTDFTLFKRSFTSSETSGPATTAAPAPKVQRTKNVFLVFDTAMSTKESTEVSQLMAQKIVRDAEAGTRFFIMTIEPFVGLVYAGGQTTDKKVLADILANKVKGRNNSRIPDANDIIRNTNGNQRKFDQDDMLLFKKISARYIKRKANYFARSFETLYYALNNITGNKFVYVFSEGVSNGMQIEGGDWTHFQSQMSIVADYLGRSGAVLFLINPFGGLGAGNEDYSGEDSLQFLAQKSGGKYMTGRDQQVLENIGNIHKSYYEIFFPATVEPGSGVLRIAVKSKRKGVDIHSLKVTEKTRKYRQMKDVEREIMALNLVSGNPLYKSNLAVEAVTEVKSAGKKNALTYTLDLPESMVKKNLDVYKVYLTKENYEITATRVETQAVSPAGRELAIGFKKVKSRDETYFVVVDGGAETALVYGIETEQEKAFRLTLADETLAAEQWATAETMQKDLQARTPEERQELARLLIGAAQYCDKLKKAAFHYTCKENIREVQTPLTKARNLHTDVTTDPGQPGFTRPHGWRQREQYTTDQVISPAFHYRLLKLGEQVREERDLAKKTDQKKKKEKKEFIPKNTGEALKGVRFLSSKAVFGPLTLLSADRRGRYRFKLLERTKLKDRPVSVIEALPKDAKDAMFVYGKIWIDSEDFSVLKIKANPNSIVGYEGMVKLAEELGSRLMLTLETEFYKTRGGIRFPTRIHFLEHYKSGRYMTYLRGARGWKRTETVTQYTDFLFFDVNSDVTYQQ